jgi:hypothetical protein
MSVELEKRVDKIELDLKDLKNMVTENRARIMVAEHSIQDIKSSLAKIQDNTTWIIRLVVGAIVLAVIGFYLTNGGSLK